MLSTGELNLDDERITIPRLNSMRSPQQPEKVQHIDDALNYSQLRDMKRKKDIDRLDLYLFHAAVHFISIYAFNI